MKVLVACEFSGIVRDAFIKHGHDAISCDLLPSDQAGPHIQGDITEVPLDGVDLLIAHPPCTYLSNSGVCWLHRDTARWIKLFEAADFFRWFTDIDVARVCIENPVMHRYGRRLIDRNIPRQTIQPWQFGHGETKATQLWLRNLPRLTPTNIVEGREQRLHKLPPSPDRARLRSTTYTGIADAMAKQWGNL